MPDNKYCYPNSNILKNKLNIKDGMELFEAEKRIVTIRLFELQHHPLKGKFDFAHLKAIHKYIFRDIYDWAGKERTVEIGKGNLFCLISNFQSYGESIFTKFFAQCYAAKDDKNQFVKVLADNYGDLNALHPFREGNGRTQREFVRTLCLECGYDFSLHQSTHKEMLEASKLSFDRADNSLFVKIFSKAVTPHNRAKTVDDRILHICSSDDLTIKPSIVHDEQNKFKSAKQKKPVKPKLKKRVDKDYGLCL